MSLLFRESRISLFPASFLSRRARFAGCWRPNPASLPSLLYFSMSFLLSSSFSPTHSTVSKNSPTEGTVKFAINLNYNKYIITFFFNLNVYTHTNTHKVSHLRPVTWITYKLYIIWKIVTHKSYIISRKSLDNVLYIYIKVVFHMELS